MPIAVRFEACRTATAALATVVLLGTQLAGCASVPRQFSPVSLDTPQVQFSLGRVLLVLTDENGLPMPRTRVDFSWESPYFYKTSAFTDGTGYVTFSGVPEVAEVSIDHPGGNYTRILYVPQRGTSELRVILDTYGENQKYLERLRTPLDQQPRQQQ
jgi:hypothetical protein